MQLITKILLIQLRGEDDLKITSIVKLTMIFLIEMRIPQTKNHPLLRSTAQSKWYNQIIIPQTNFSL